MEGVSWSGQPSSQNMTWSCTVTPLTNKNIKMEIVRQEQLRISRIQSEIWISCQFKITYISYGVRSNLTQTSLQIVLSVNNQAQIYSRVKKILSNLILKIKYKTFLKSRLRSANPIFPKSLFAKQWA